MPERLNKISKMNPTTGRESVVFGDVIYPPGGICGPRIQRDYQLVIIHQGGLVLRLDGEAIAVEAGQAILLTPSHREHFFFSRDAETRHSWCSVAPAAIPAEMRRAFGLIRRPAPFDSHLTALLKLWRRDEGNTPTQMLENCYHLSLGLALLSGFALSVQAGKTAKNSGDEALERMEAFISCEYSKPLKLAHLATAAGVSRQHLLKLFRERQWPTPTDYLYGKRLEKSADLLAHTGLSVGEIADRCGFANPFHFSRKFRQTYGKSPRAWRIQTWSES